MRVVARSRAIRRKTCTRWVHVWIVPVMDPERLGFGSALIFFHANCGTIALEGRPVSLTTVYKYMNLRVNQPSY